MTRDPARIDLILADLRRYWHAAPDLRLGQMVMGLLNLSGAPRYGEFNAEDDKVAAYLAAWAAANQPPPDHRDTMPPEIEAAIAAAAWTVAELDRRADVMAQPEIGALRTAITSALAAAREAGRRGPGGAVMFDEEPDRDPHGECRAEIARLTAELAAARQIADARREWLGTGDAAKSPPRTDTGAIAADMLACAEAWAPGAMLMGNVRADEIAAVCRELAAARAVPADVEAAIDAYEARVTSLVTSMTGRAADDAAAVDVARNNLRAAIARAIAEARQPATVGGLLAHLASGKPFTSPRWLAGHVLRVDAATGRLWRLDYNDPDEMHLTRYVLSDRAFSISDVLAADYVVVADTPVMDHAWRTRPASRGPLPKGG